MICIGTVIIMKQTLRSRRTVDIQAKTSSQQGFTEEEGEVKFHGWGEGERRV